MNYGIIQHICNSVRELAITLDNVLSVHGTGYLYIPVGRFAYLVVDYAVDDLIELHSWGGAADDDKVFYLEKYGDAVALATDIVSEYNRLSAKFAYLD